MSHRYTFKSMNSNEEDFFVKRPDGDLVSPIVIINEKYNTGAQYEETIKNKKDCIFQTVLRINGVIKATGWGYNAKISKIQAALQFYSSNECIQSIENSTSDLGKSMECMKLRSSQEHKTDSNSSDSSSSHTIQMQPMTIKSVISATSFGRLLRFNRIGMGKCHAIGYSRLQQEQNKPSNGMMQAVYNKRCIY